MLNRSVVAATTASAGLLVLAGPAVASPQFQSNYKLGLTTNEPGISTGLNTVISLKDVGDAQKRPKILTGVRITLPRGTKTDPKGHAACRSKKKPINDNGFAAVCASKTRYGTGQANVILGTTPLSFPINSYNFEPIDFFAGKPQLALDLVLDPTNPALAFSLSADIKPSLFFSLSLTPQFDIHTTRIKLSLPASSKGKHVFFRTPNSCPRSRHWTGKITTTFVDHSKEEQAIKLPCHLPRA